MESHLQSAMVPHLDLTCVKLNNTQVELKNAQERIRKLEQQVKFKDEQEAVRKLEQQVELKNAQETIRKLKEKFHTRKMLWKINEFGRIMREAKNEEKKYIESDPFYTEIPGYKLKVFFCPNGFGSGENTHLSVYIVLMKGEYDAILPWPFNRKVTFTLIDQDEDLLKRKNVVAELTPDHVIPGTTSRPRRGENKKASAVGCHDLYLIGNCKQGATLRTTLCFFRLKSTITTVGLAVVLPLNRLGNKLTSSNLRMQDFPDLIGILDLFHLIGQTSELF